LSRDSCRRPLRVSGWHRERTMSMAKGSTRREFVVAVGKAACGCALVGGIGAVGRADDKPKAVLDAYCGMYCAACPLYMASVAAESEEDVKCLGCKSDKNAPHCSDCAVRKCAQAKELDSCGECQGFPCAKTKALHEGGKDKFVLAEKGCYAIKEGDRKKWLKAQKKRWKCRKCGTSFSMADEACPKCGADVLSCKEEAAEYKETRK